VVDRARLAEAHPQTPPAHVHRRDTASVVEPPDRSDRAVRHVERAVTLPKLDPVPHRKALLLDSLHLEAAALLRVEDPGKAGPLHPHVEAVSLLVDGDDTRPIAGLDAAAATHETQHVAVGEARRPPLLLARQVLLHHDSHLDALPLDLAPLDERFPDPAVEVRTFEVARGDHDPAAAFLHEVARDPLVP
jgi:hypothetical protein